MSRFIRPALGILCLGVLALAVFTFDRACLRRYPLLEENPLLPSMAEVLARKEQLQHLEQESGRRGQAKRQVAEEVLAGRCSLAEAIERFQALDQAAFPRPYPRKRCSLAEVIERFRVLDPEGFLRPYPADQMSGHVEMSEEEYDGWNVLLTVQQLLADRPAEAAAVIGRLEKGLQQLLAKRTKHRSAPVEGGR